MKLESEKFSAYWLWLSAELKRRNVYSVTAAYAVVAFIVLQLAEITFEPLGIPNWVMISLIAVVLAGFPLVVFVAWVFQITPHGIRVDRSQPYTRVDRRPSIAVLPFADMSPERDQGYFCEGVAEEILNSLSQISEIRVAARTSSFQYNSHAVDANTVGESLRVDSILEGSVRKSGNHLRISAQLIAVKDGSQLWAKTYDSEYEDIFVIQDEIADNIAQSLATSLSTPTDKLISPYRSQNVSAYDFYLRGRQFVKRFRRQDLEFALQMFIQAKNRDSHFALAWAGIADCYSLLAMYVDNDSRYAEEARRASRHAHHLRQDLAEVHASLGLAELASARYEAAEKAFKQAISLNPNLFEAYYYYGRTLFHENQMEEAVKLFAKAAEVDPADYQSRCLRVQILNGLGESGLARKEAEESVRVLEQHLQWNPDDIRAYHLGAGNLIILGQREKASTWLQKAISMDPDDPVVLYNAACNYALMGKPDEAFENLEKAIESGTVSAAWMCNDGDLKVLRQDERFETLLARAGT